MTIAVNTTKSALATYYGQQGTWISLHYADPSTTGANEANTTNSPGYARKQTTWSAAGPGVIQGTMVPITVGANTWQYAGLWNDATSTNAANFIDKVAINPTQLSGTGVLQVTPTFTIS